MKDPTLLRRIKALVVALIFSLTQATAYGGSFEPPGKIERPEKEGRNEFEHFKSLVPPPIPPKPEIVRRQRLVGFLEFADKSFLTDKSVADRLADDADWGGPFFGFEDQTASSASNQDIPASIRLFRPDWKTAFSIASVNLLPRNEEEFKRVFSSSSVSQKQIDEMERLELRDENASDIEQALGTADGIVVFIGHSENGFLKDREGQAHSIRELAKSCVERLKLCLFLSCYAGQFTEEDALGAKTAISARQALDEAARIQTRATQLLEALSVSSDKTAEQAALERWKRYREFIDGTAHNLDELSHSRYLWYSWQAAVNYGPELGAFIVLALIAGSVSCHPTERPC